MSSSDAPPGATETEVEMMRRALGLSDHPVNSECSPDPRAQGGLMQRHDQDRRARRFVRDGEVPVVVLNRPRDTPGVPAAPTNRLATAEAALRAERAARERAERGLQESQLALQHLQTQVGHMALAHAEAVAAEREARDLAERQLTEALAARDASQAALAELMAALPAPTQVAPTPVASMPIARLEPVVREPRSLPKADPKDAPKRGRGRPRIVQNTTEPEPEAVKWWLPTYKARSRSG